MNLLKTRIIPQVSLTGLLLLFIFSSQTAQAQGAGSNDGLGYDKESINASGFFQGIFKGDLSAWTFAERKLPAFSGNTVEMPAHLKISIPTGFTNPIEQVTATVKGGILQVEGLAEGEAWKLYNISGVLVKQGIADSNVVTIRLSAQGAYIIQSENHTLKFIY